METREILEKVRRGEVSVEEAQRLIEREPFEELGFAKLDTQRQQRQGFGEVVFCSGKADEHLLAIFRKLQQEQKEVLGTRASREQYELVRQVCPEVVYDPLAKLLKIEKKDKPHVGNIVVCTAG
ncbi:MAG: 1-(5-phosphoribosyl)-5-amino-4-imidazole-carboxylate carboxylase, partial [Acidaminococcus sp.]|nr:1-(5-phosphoribosyl)-5-amino-4-imidazole-carboxylate carboxylase [Acidaminococcus sp.]